MTDQLCDPWRRPRRRRPWSERRRRQITAMINGGASIQDIADAVGLTYWGTVSRLKDEGMNARIKPRIDWTALGPHAVAMSNNGTSMYKISRTLGVSEAGIMAYFKRIGHHHEARARKRKYTS